MTDLVYKDLRKIIGGHLETSLFIAALITGADHEKIDGIWTNEVHEKIKTLQHQLVVTLDQMAADNLK